jgi:hypothetical protein
MKDCTNYSTLMVLPAQHIIHKLMVRQNEQIKKSNNFTHLHLDIAEFALNNWIHTGTQQTSFMMMYGFNPQSTSRDSIPSNNPLIINHTKNLKKTRLQAEYAF